MTLFPVVKNLSLKAVIFDFDGTLAKMNIDFSLMRRHVLELLSCYTVTPDDLKDLYVLEMIAAGRNRVALSHPGRENEFERSAYAGIADIEIQAARQGCLFEGVRSMLQELNKRGIKTGVITRNCQAALEILFPDIRNHVEAVITRDQTPHVKPHPGHILMMLNQLAVTAGQAAMVGDHPMDMTTGKDAGVYAVGVLSGVSRTEDLTQAGADIVLEGASDILDILA